jgi:hypothetical protein
MVQVSYSKVKVLNEKSHSFAIGGKVHHGSVTYAQHPMGFATLRGPHYSVTKGLIVAATEASVGKYGQRR